MFSKKCKSCNKKISKDYDFCPYCGSSVHSLEDYGLIGKEDITTDNEGIKLPFGFNMLFNTLLKELDKQFKELDNQVEEKSENKITKKTSKKGGFSISITSTSGKPPEIKIKSLGGGIAPEASSQPKLIPAPVISDKNIKKLSTLPREEATANVRRLANKVVYEINVPGVESIDDVVVNQLENSIEVRAIGKNKVHFKLIPINLPLKRYVLKDNKLILELDTRE